VLVNKAGVYSFGPLESATEQEFQRQFNTNVLGVILATQEAVKLFAERVAALSTSVPPPLRLGAPNHGSLSRYEERGRFRDAQV
jgi:3-oxoacyl-[acyl-carrier protein] reductase